MKKYVTVLLAALLLAVSSAGCAPELYERALISAVGVDKTEAGCRVTVRAALPADDGQEISLSGEGRTVPEALNEIALFPQHARGFRHGLRQKRACGLPRFFHPTL